MNCGRKRSSVLPAGLVAFLIPPVSSDRVARAPYLTQFNRRRPTGHTMRVFLALSQVVWALPATAGEEIRVPLRVDVVKGQALPRGWPVTTGVPFRDGQLTDQRLGLLQLHTESGKPVPAQFEVRGRYLKSKAVKWLGVSFPLEPGVQGYLLRADASAAPVHPERVRVEEAGHGFRVRTGAFKVEIPGIGAMLSRAWLGEEVLMEQRPGDGNWFVTVDGNRYQERAEKATLERSGPLHATVRVDGRYVDSRNNPSCKWTARLHFYAGRPEIGITHTFSWIGNPGALKIRDLAISFGLKQRYSRAAADASDTDSGQLVTASLDAKNPFSLLQDTYWRLGHGENHFGVYLGDKALRQGERAGSWVGLAEGCRAVTLVLRDFWQQFPKELEARPDRLSAYLWRTRGQALPLDLSFNGLQSLLGPVLLETYRTQTKSQYEQLGRSPEMLDPTGMAKTHDLLLAFHSAGTGLSPSEAGKVFDDPPLVLPDPQWTYRSGVVGPLWPKDPQRFPEWEKRIERTWRDVFEVIDDWGDYGFIYYGDGPHYTYRFSQEGRPVADVMRYTGIDAWVQYVAWLAYLRSGDRRYFRYAHAHTRFLGDVCASHADTEHRWIGLTGCHVIPWYAVGMGRFRGRPMGGPGPLVAYGLFPDHVLFAFYLTGDHRHMDVARAYGHHWKRFFRDRPGWKQEAVATANGHLSKMNFARLQDLAVLAEGLEDFVLLDEAKAMARLLLLPDSSDGVGRDASDSEEGQRNAYLMSALAESPQAAKMLLFVLHKQTPWPAAEFAFQKEAGKALEVELSAAQSSTFVGPDGKPMSEAWLGPAVTYVPHHDSVTAFNTHEPMLYRTLRIPAEAPSGEVRVRIPGGSQAYVFSTNASRYVLAASQGLMLGPGMTLRTGKPLRLGLGGGARDRWYFQVPIEARAFRVRSSVVKNLEVLDPSGNPVALKTSEDGVAEVPVGSEHAGRLWSLRARLLADVALADVVPVFAYGDGKSHFLPEGIPFVRELPVMPAFSPKPMPHNLQRHSLTPTQ
jgi:hypothetical protein